MQDLTLPGFDPTGLDPAGLLTPPAARARCAALAD